jgi:hypothetical protein
LRLKYKSLVTRENIENILSRIEGRQQVKSNLINLLSKIDIRISTEPVKLVMNSIIKYGYLKEKQNIKHISKITIL